MNEMVQMNKARDLLALWVRKIELSSAIDFYDINKISENLCANLLNEIYGYLLINLNPEKRNFPAVDLGCDVKKIAFQITATKEADKVKEKIESTLEKFVNHNLQSRFTDGLRFLFLTTDKLVKLTDANKKKYQGIYSSFDENHLLTLQDLIQEIQVLYNKDNKRFCKVLKILERELSPQSAENITEIVKILTDKHQQESQAKDEQIKALTHAITALSQGQGVIGTEAQINSAFVALKRGDVTEAKSLFAKAAETSESAIQSESQKAAEAYRNLGALAFWDNTQEALNAYRRATELDSDNVEGWNQLGRLLHRIGDLENAIIVFEKILELGKTTTNNKIIALAYCNLGVQYQITGELDKSLNFCLKSLEINREIKNQQGMAIDYGNLGAVYGRQGEIKKSEEFQLKSLEINKKLNNEMRVAQNYINLGRIYSIQGKTDEAIEIYKKSLKLNQELNIQEGIIQAYNNIGHLYEGDNKFQNAIENYEEAFQLSEKLVYKEGMAIVCCNLGNIYRKINDIETAFLFYEGAMYLNLELNRKEGVANIYGILGVICYENGNLNQALEMHYHSLKINTELNKRESIAENYLELGDVYLAQGNREQTKEYWQKSIELYKYISSPEWKDVQKWLDDLK